MKEVGKSKFDLKMASSDSESDCSSIGNSSYSSSGSLVAPNLVDCLGCDFPSLDVDLNEDGLCPACCRMQSSSSTKPVQAFMGARSSASANTRRLLATRRPYKLNSTAVAAGMMQYEIVVHVFYLINKQDALLNQRWQSLSLILSQQQQ
jgi:hypothetical protein